MIPHVMCDNNNVSKITVVTDIVTVYVGTYKLINEYVHVYAFQKY